MSLMTQLTPLGTSFPVSWSVGSSISLSFGFASFDTSDIEITFKLLLLTMSIPISQLTVEQSHKEFNSLADKIAAKYEQINTSEFEAVSISAFNAKSAKLASLFTYMSQLCQRLNLSMPAQPHRLPFFKHFSEHFSDLNCTVCRQAVLVRVWKMQLCL